MYVRAYGEIAYPIDIHADALLPDLKEHLLDAVGQPVRRISRFMQLALIGAGRCARGMDLPKDTAVYLASSRGDLEISVDVMNHVFRDGQAPKPLSFVNTVSNSAAYYVAKCLQLEARSSFACNRYFAFEAALQLVATDFQLGTVRSALVGTVDSAVLPISAHRARLELDKTTPLAEGSHWLWLTQEASGNSPCKIVAVHCASDQAELLQWIAANDLDNADTLISAGQYLSDTEYAAIKTHLDLNKEFHYRQARGHYASQSAAAIAEFIRDRHTANTLLHINGDALGRRMAMLIRKQI